MAGWRTWASGLVVLVGAAGAVSAQSYSLTEALEPGVCARYRLEMNLTGELHVTRDEKIAVLKLNASASHDLTERLLTVTAGVPQKTARIYDAAKASIQVDNDRSNRILRPSRSLVVAQRAKDQTVVYSPKGMLTSQEMELTNGHFDTLALFGLLPTKSVAVDDKWKVPTAAVQGLCHLEGVTSQDLVAQLIEAKDQVARVTVTGSVSGIDLGAPTKITVTAEYRFNLKDKQLASMEWKEKDERGQGPASPASVIETTCSLKRARTAEPANLSEVALICVPPAFDIPDDMLLLSYRDAKGRFSLKYAREWQTVGQTEEHLVMRLMDRGDFIAQATITPWLKAKPGAHLSPEEFRRAMANTPGWQQSEVLQAGEIEAPNKDRWIYRMSAVGMMDDMKLIQNFYLVAWPNGDQLVLAFTLTPTEAEKLGGRDQAMVINAELPGAANGE